MAKISHHVIHPMSDGNHMIEHHMAPKHGKGGMSVEYEEPTKHVLGSKCEHCGPIRDAMGAEEEADEEKISPGIHKKVAKMEKEEGE